MINSELSATKSRRLGSLVESKLARSAAAMVCGAALAALGTRPNTAGAASPDCGGYLYAGELGPTATAGLSATITQETEPVVTHGHATGWIGVGGAGMGPSGTDEWLQVGINRESTQPTSHLYYEVTLPRIKARLVSLGQIGTGQAVKLKVGEVYKDHWAVYVNGRRRSPLYNLPKSHSAFKPVFIAEQSGANNTDNSCNSFDFKFDNLEARQAGSNNFTALDSLSTMQDHGYEVIPTHKGFIARSQNT